MINLIACIWTIATPMQTPKQETLHLKDSRFTYSVIKATAGKNDGKLRIMSGGKAIQDISITGIANLEPENTIAIKDVDFDGQDDLMIISDRGVVNNAYAYYLFDSATKKFVYNPIMSRILVGSSIKFDKSKKEILVESRSGCCSYEWKKYKFEGNGLKLFETRKKDGKS